MKTKIASSALIIVALCGTVKADPQSTSVSTNDYSRDRADWSTSRHPLGKLERANKLIGTEVKDSQNEKLGKVKDLAIDLQNGRIVEVIVGRGGVLGVDEKYVAVPPGQFTCDTNNHTLVLNTDKERFKNAPIFVLAEWDSNVHQPAVQEVYQYYGVTPYFAADDHALQYTNSSRASYRLGGVERASKLIGSTARNSQSEKVGKVENLLVDLQGGRVVEVILASGGFLGMGDELSAIPPQAFRLGMERDTLTLDTTKDALATAPHFKSSEWPDINDPQQVTSVYRAYRIEPDFGTNAADNTIQNVRDRSDSAITPLSQGASQTDVEISRQIRKQIIATSGLSVNAQNIKVITVDGKVTLRGPVNSEDEKRQIEAIAAKVATASNVDDQIQIANTSTTKTPTEDNQK